MPLNLRTDGYTLPFETKPEILDRMGGKYYENLPVVKGTYRPPLFATRQEYIFKLGRATSGEDEANIIAEFICARLQSWDVTVQDNPQSSPRPAPIKPEFLKQWLPEPIVQMILEAVSKWGPALSEVSAAGNSPAGSA